MPDENATKQTQYTLTSGEKSVLLNLGNALAQHKLAIYNLNMQLEAEQGQRDAAEAKFNGALAMIAEPRGFARVQLAPDFSTITEAK